MDFGWVLYLVLLVLIALSMYCQVSCFGAYQELFERLQGRNLIGKYDGPEWEWNKQERFLADSSAFYWFARPFRQLRLINKLVPPQQFTADDKLLIRRIWLLFFYQFVLALILIYIFVFRM